VLPRIVQVEVHLSDVSWRELPDLEVDDHERSQPPVEENEVDSEPSVADSKPPLTADEREIASELHQE